MRHDRAAIRAGASAPSMALLLSICFASGCAQHDEGTLPGTVERDRVELAAEADEFIVALPFTEGAPVKAGDIIVVQDRAISAAELDAARAQLAEAEARVEELKNGPRITSIRAAAARRDRARAERDDAVRERDRLLDLVKQNLVSRSEADRQMAAASAAEAGLHEAESDLRELQEGTRSEQLTQARQAADNLRATLRGLETSSARLEVRAPIAGTLDALPFHVGEKPARGATVAVLLADEAPYARIHVPAPLRAQVKQGSQATLRADGVDRAYRGHVRFIASEAEFTPYYSLTAADRSRLSFLAEVLFDDAEARSLPSGIPVDVTLDLRADDGAR
jgi:HlyD family secretion protein